jgi:hypothetical protein
MDLTYAQAADIEPMMKEIAIMTDLRHDNIVRYIGSDCNMAKKEVRHHHSCLCLRLCVCVFVCLCVCNCVCNCVVFRLVTGAVVHRALLGHAEGRDRESDGTGSPLHQAGDRRLGLPGVQRAQLPALQEHHPPRSQGSPLDLYNNNNFNYYSYYN